MIGYIVNLRNDVMRVISFEELCTIHNQIYRQDTGTPEEFAEKVEFSKS